MEPTATPPPQATPPVAPPPALVRPVRPAEMDDPSKWPRFLPHVTVSWDPSPARFHYEKKLGRGAYGFTFRLRDVMNPHAAPIALKVMNLLKPGDKPPNRKVESEADLQVTSKDRVQAELDHMGLVQNHFAFPKLLGWTYVDPTADHDQAHALVFMECCDGGDLQAAIHARAYHAKGSFPFLEIEVHLVFVHLLCALNHLHRQGATHRDIKSANILLVANSVLTDFQTTSGLYANYKPTGLDNIARVGCCKLTDFGFASIKRELKTKLGTWEYWAPELFNGTDTYTNKVDVWAAGVVLYEMIALQRPFPERNHMKRMQDAVTKGQFPPLEGLKWAGNFNRLHQELFSTVASMLTVDEAARPSVSELLDSNFGRTAIDNFCRWAVSNAQTQASSLFMALRQDEVTLPDWVMAQLTAIPPPSHRAAVDEFDDLAPPEDDPDFDLGCTPESTDPASPRSANHAEGVATSMEQPEGDGSPGGGSRLRRVLARARSSDQFESPFLPQAGASVLREPLTPLSTPLRNMPTMPAAALASAATPPRASRPHPPRGYDARAYPRSAIVTNVAVALTSPTNSNPAKSTSRPASDRDSSPASADALRVDSADGPPSM